VLLVGLTGGIGAGKSEVIRRLAERGAQIIDADVLARDAVAPGTAGLAAVVAAFGEDVLTSAGGLDRDRLSGLVFADPDARKRLNGIVHPLVRAETARRIAAAPPQAIVVNDVPLLVEAGLAALYPVVVVIGVTPATQLDRLVRFRGMAPADAEARIAAQAPLADKLAVATYVIDNDGPLAALDPQIADLWRELSRRVESNGRPDG
jgi:dephospho-CoA kinase